MISEQIRNEAEKLEIQGKMIFKEGASEEQITVFEKANNLNLPLMYREWLKFSDGGELFLPGGVQLYGVKHKPLIDVNDDDRPDDSYVVIGALASGDPVVFKKSEETISIYNHEAGIIEEDESYDDFLSFLGDLYDMLGIGD